MVVRALLAPLAGGTPAQLLVIRVAATAMNIRA